MKYKQLTAAQRCKIEVLHSLDYTYSQIALETGCNKSTICRELKKFSTPNGYFSDIAQIGHETNQSNCGRKVKILQKIGYSEYVIGRIKNGWSPEQISGRLNKINTEFQISHEAIYQFIYNHEYCKREKLYQYLRRGKRKRTKKYGRKTQTEKLKNKISIELRPDISNRREFGHWEGDSIVSKGRKAFILTCVERKTRYIIAKKQLGHKAIETGNLIIEGLKQTIVKSITFDNGVEFAKHEEISKQLNTAVYFCHPYSSWERGTNENSNGLLRRYIPKRENFENLDEKELDSIIGELNNRPRKCLNYSTPLESYQSNLLINRQIVALNS